MVLGRKTKVIERETSSAGSRAAEVVGDAASDFAERAVAAAQNAQRVATPVLRTAAEKSAETLSHAAERAAVVLQQSRVQITGFVGAIAPVKATGCEERRAAIHDVAGQRERESWVRQMALGVQPPAEIDEARRR